MPFVLHAKGDQVRGYRQTFLCLNILDLWRFSLQKEAPKNDTISVNITGHIHVFQFLNWNTTSDFLKLHSAALIKASRVPKNCTWTRVAIL